MSASTSAAWLRRYSRRPSQNGRTRCDVEVVEEALVAGEDDGDLLLDGHGVEAALVEHLDHALAARQRPLGDLVEVGAELRERLQLAVLGQVELQAAGDLRMALICALPPTRLTEMPMLMAGRIPE